MPLFKDNLSGHKGVYFKEVLLYMCTHRCCISASRCCPLTVTTHAPTDWLVTMASIQVAPVLSGRQFLAKLVVHVMLDLAFLLKEWVGPQRAQQHHSMKMSGKYTSVLIPLYTTSTYLAHKWKP